MRGTNSALNPLPTSIRPALWLVGLLGVIALFHFLTITPGHDWGDDFAMYIAHARNLVEGRPYSDTGYIYNPDEPIGPPRAPPGLPFLLAPIYALRGADLIAMKMLMVVALVVTLALLAVLVRRWDGIGSAIAVTALLGFHPLFWEFKNNIMSDLPFLCFFLLSVWLAERSLATPAVRSAALRTGIALGVAWWAAYATRTIGVVLPVAFIIMEYWTWRRLQRSTFVALMLFTSLSLVQAALFQSPHDYLIQSSFQPELIKPNILDYGKNLRGLLDGGFGWGWTMATFLVANTVAVVGLLKTWKAGVRQPAIIVVIYMGTSIFWPHNAGVRYLIPVIPFYFFYIVAGVASFARQPVHLRPLIAVCAAALALTIYVGRYHLLMTTPQAPGIDGPNARTLFAFVQGSTPVNAVVIFKKPRALALYTGRRAAVPPTIIRSDPWRFIDKIGATYFAQVLLSTGDSVYLRRLELERPHSVSKVFGNEEFTVYELGRGGQNE